MKTLMFTIILTVVSVFAFSQSKELRSVEDQVRELFEANSIKTKYWGSKDTCANCGNRISVEYTLIYNKHKRSFFLKEAACKYKKILTDKNLLHQVQDVAISLEFPNPNFDFFIIILQNP